MTHRSSPYSCEVGAEDLVSVLGGGHSDRAVRNHICTYHPQEVSVGRVTQHALRLAGRAGLLHFPTGEPIVVPTGSLHKIQCDLALDGLEIDVGHALRILADDDVPLIRVDDEVAGIHTSAGIVSDPPNFGYHLEWDDVCDSSLVEPHAFELPEGSNFVHGSRSTVAVPD